ncbi:MAG TPA: hypothetical protein VG944_04035 [Fimbriimonas sp.]|nr:hypothetical protein [Fimbriimonas sp.]
MDPLSRRYLVSLEVPDEHLHVTAGTSPKDDSDWGVCRDDSFDSRRSGSRHNAS